jgi:hypothetical protein
MGRRPAFPFKGRLARLGLRGRSVKVSAECVRVKAHYLHGHGAGHFSRWLGARSDVIYTIMSDE